MKKIFSFIVMLCFVVFATLTMSTSALYAKQKSEQTVTFFVHLHCDNCVDKVMKNVAFEKGVKDIRCDIDTKKVTVVFNPDKTNITVLQEAFKKINKPAFLSWEDYQTYYKE